MGQAEIISEHFPHKVSAVFDGAERAKQAVVALDEQLGLNEAQVELVRPNDPKVERKMEPETGAIFSTILRSHAVLAGVGAVAGLILAAVLVGAGFAFAQTRPGWVFGILAVVGGAIGMLVAGLVSIRPDHESVIVGTEEASERDQWTVTVHARDEDQKGRVDELLKTHAANVRESL